MKIQFIGTGSGKASLKRFHSSLLITSGGYNLLIDCGDGISKALLYNSIEFNSIEGILITHFHPDHYSGIAALLVQMKLTGRTSSLAVFVHQSNLEYLQRFIYQSYIFIERLGFELRFIPFTEDELVRINDSLVLLTKQNSHLAAYKGFDRNNELSFSCSSIMFEEGNKTVLFTGDIGDKEDLFLFNNKKIDLLISEVSHVEIADILKAFRSQKISGLYLTHISDDDDSKLEKLYASIFDNEKKIIAAAFEGLIINL